jgi:hypothetical protein
MIDVGKDQLLAILDDIRHRVACGDSYEGFLSYQFPEEPVNGHDFAVYAGYRIGNLQGQGGMRFVGLDIRPAGTNTHEPVWVPGGPDRNQVAACTCGARPAADLHGTAWFSSHLQETGSADYLVGYWRDWADVVEAPDARLSRDQVARELHDYRVVMGEASKVYEELAGLSKPNTAAHHIITRAEERARETYVDLVLSDLLPTVSHETDRQAVIDWAEDMVPDSYQQHLDQQAVIGALRAKAGAQ